MKLTLDVRLDGFDDPAGELIRNEKGALSFTYTKHHLSAANAFPLSLSLPLTNEPYRDFAARAFFDNLLQERDSALTDIMAREGLERDDVAGLLLHLGQDCPGALSVLPAGAAPVKVPGELTQDYLPINEEDLSRIVRALYERRRLPDGVNDPSPLAGVQSKLAITLLPNGQFAQPVPGTGAPTTHIIKVPDRDHPNDAKQEAATMDLSRSLGFATAETVAIRIADLEILLVERFDRTHDDRGRIIRVHQEDFAQALGLPAALKYERRGTKQRKFDVEGVARILNKTKQPAVSRDVFINATLFDLLTGNVDAHAKNHALLYAAGSVALAPRYDLLPTRLDRNLTDELAFKIGSAARIEEITTRAFEDFLTTLGVSSARARSRIRVEHSRRISTALAAALQELGDKGMKAFADLIASNMRTLLPVLGVDVPEAARHRDAFVERGGGWAQS